MGNQAASNVFTMHIDLSFLNIAQRRITNKDIYQMNEKLD
jgi:hypothetical protein